MRTAPPLATFRVAVAVAVDFLLLTGGATLREGTKRGRDQEAVQLVWLRGPIDA